MRESFLYANGVVASLTNNYIPKESFNRMLESKTAEEALSVLQETQFASGIAIETPFEIETMLSFETTKLINFIKEESPIEELVSFFALPYDYNNISAFCKGIITNSQNNVRAFVETEGIYPLSRIRELITTKNFDGFENKHIKNALLEFQTLASKPNVRGDEIDFIFKKHLYKNLKEACAKNSLTKKLVEIRIDVENISTAMRASSQYQLEQQLLDCVALNKDMLLKIFNKNKDVLFNLKENKILNKFVTLALSENKEKSFAEFEKFKNSYPFILLEEKKNDIDSAYPFAHYCFKKLVEIKNVRLIISYLNNNLHAYIKNRFLEC